MWYTVEIHTSGNYVDQPLSDSRTFDQVIQVHAKPSLKIWPWNSASNTLSRDMITLVKSHEKIEKRHFKEAMTQLAL